MSSNMVIIPMTTKAAINGCCYKKNEHILVLFVVIEATMQNLLGLPLLT